MAASCSFSGLLERVEQGDEEADALEVGATGTGRRSCASSSRTGATGRPGRRWWSRSTSSIRSRTCKRRA